MRKNKENKVSKGRQLSKGQRFELLEKKVQQLEMTTRVNQMMLQQVGNTMGPMQGDLSEFIGRQRELQYRVLAVQELANLETDAIEAKSLELQVRDFEETSAKEDEEKNYTPTDVVAEDTAIIVTTTTPDEEQDRGILRSKLLYSDISLPELAESLLGSKVGDTVDADINGVKHKVEVLGIRKVPEPQPEEEAETNTQQVVQGSTSGEEQQSENG